MSSKTAEGLRDRLFNALDLYIAKKVSAKEIEGICYLSEQILKTSNIELDFQRQRDEQTRFDKRSLLELKKEENIAAELLQITLKKVEENV